MANRTYKASLRQGSKASPGSKRVSVTIKDADFDALRAIADKKHQTIGGTAAELLRVALKKNAMDASFDALAETMKKRQVAEREDLTSIEDSRQ